MSSKLLKGAVICGVMFSWHVQIIVYFKTSDLGCDLEPRPDTCLYLFCLILLKRSSYGLWGGWTFETTHLNVFFICSFHRSRICASPRTVAGWPSAPSVAPPTSFLSTLMAALLAPVRTCPPGWSTGCLGFRRAPAWRKSSRSWIERLP